MQPHSVVCGITHTHTRTSVAARLQHVLWPECSPCINTSCGAHSGTHLRVIIIITCGCMSGRLPPAAAAADGMCAVTERGEERGGSEATMP